MNAERKLWAPLAFPFQRRRKAAKKKFYIIFAICIHSKWAIVVLPILFARPSRLNMIYFELEYSLKSISADFHLPCLAFLNDNHNNLLVCSLSLSASTRIQFQKLYHTASEWAEWVIEWAELRYKNQIDYIVECNDVCCEMKKQKWQINNDELG